MKLSSIELSTLNPIELTESDIKRVSTMLALLMAFAVVAVWTMPAWAWGTAPTSGDPGFAIYDIFITKGVKGAPGQTVGIMLMGLAATLLNQSWVKAGLVGAGGGVLFNAESLASSFGMPLPM